MIHHEQGSHKRGFTAGAIAEIAENGRAQWPGQERDAKSEESIERLRRGSWEEHRSDDQGRGCAIDIEKKPCLKAGPILVPIGSPRSGSE
jgi:hypothetical protein